MQSENEKPKGNGHGGARRGAGRPATGRKGVKTITLQLGVEEAAILDKVEKRAEFVREAIRALAVSKGIGG